MSRVVDRAFDIAEHTYPRAPHSRLAYSFGLDKIALHSWRVSPDVWAALVEHAGIGDAEKPDPTARLLGDRIEVDDKLPPNSMLLLPTPRGS